MNKEHLQYAAFGGDTNIGLFGLTTDKYVILSDSAFDASILSEKIIHTTIAGTNLCGIFLAGNSHGLLVPWTITERELSTLKKGLHGVNICIIESKHTALGNLILCNDKGAVISPLLSEYRDKIAKCLGVPVWEGTILGINIVGALCTATNRGFLLDMYASESDFKLAKEALKTGGDIGTVNFGSEFVKSGILANSQAILIGSKTTGPEVARVDEALGFI